MRLLQPHCGAHHFQHLPKTIVASEAAFVEASAGDGLPVRMVAFGRGLRNTRELLIILAVLAAEFVDYKIQRRHHIETKNLPPHFPKGTAWAKNCTLYPSATGTPFID